MTRPATAKMLNVRFRKDETRKIKAYARTLNVTPGTAARLLIRPVLGLSGTICPSKK